jgi:hypothetical protein
MIIGTLAWQEYSDLAAEHHITHDGLLEVTRALHRSGTLMWFESSPALRKLGISQASSHMFIE